MVSFLNRHHNVLNKYKYCEQTLFCLFCYTSVYIKIYDISISMIFQNHCIMIPSIWWTKLYCRCEYTRVLCNYSCLTKCRKVSSFLVLWNWQGFYCPSEFLSVDVSLVGCFIVWLRVFYCLFESELIWPECYRHHMARNIGNNMAGMF